MGISTTPRRITIPEWEADWASRDECYELVDGTPTLVPTEDYRNLNATARLSATLIAALDPDTWWFAPHGSVVIREGDRPTVRIPDLVVVRRAGHEGHLRPAGAVALAVEVVSPSSERVDHIVKRREYAKAGIPAYLVIDARSTPPTLTLLTQPSDGHYLREDSGESVVLSIDGTDITIHGHNLV